MEETDPQSDVMAFLADPTNYAVLGQQVTTVERVDTHVAAVFLAGDLACKIKKAVRLPYLDFSTEPQRLAACKTELELNRRSAPELYLGLRSLGRDEHGAVAWDASEPIDHVILIHRFDRKDLLTEIAARGALTDDLARDLTDRIAAFHAQAPIIEAHPALAELDWLLGESENALLASGVDLFGRVEIAGLIANCRDAMQTHGATLEKRASEGRVRHCHGDLHLDNICLYRGEPTLFDALEFDPRLARIDVLYDLAFLIMDLELRGLRRAASVILNRYLDRREEQDGLVLLPLFVTMRAIIRSYTSASAGHTDLARDYFALAQRMLTPGKPCLVAIGGFSGSGKSRLARLLAPELGETGGARILRSDVIRKNRAGLDRPEERLAPEEYSRAASEAVYDAMRRQAASLMATGVSVICDAVHGTAQERAAVEGIAKSAGLPFWGFWLEATPEVMEARVAARHSDASDATAAVLRGQLAWDIGPIGWRRLRTDDAATAALDAARVVLAEVLR